MHAHEMISTHPQVRGNTNDSLIRCIEECFDCAQSWLRESKWLRAQEVGAYS